MARGQEGQVKMKPWEFKAQSAPKVEQKSLETLPLKKELLELLDFTRWAENLLTLYGRLRVETPETPAGSQVVNAPAWELHELLFYRLRAEAWGAWGVVYGRGASGEYELVSSILHP